ncbi:MAG: family 43 glycosylhydrolase [Prevotella sp.]|nr:family 43 glycosylhydrolase [Prevotella sp.]
MQRVSVHDPSIVYEEATKRYYIFGTHKAGAYTTNLQSWTQANPKWKVGSNNDAPNNQAFLKPAVKTVMKGGEEVALPQFNAMDWSKRTDSGYNIDGNMWAPDVLWNPTMEKWCMYLSINGDAWHSSIILLTADQITGPWEYQGPVVICGFDNGSHSYKDTDLELVLGKQSSLPARYNVGDGWGRRWPHTIDPCVFYDEDGQLRFIYGSWSGGIWMLDLDEKTGLRDYNVVYPSTNGNSDGVTSDPYFGKKIAGGYYVSGEGPYIEHIGKYYYLFVTYGFLSSDGGYEMRVFRSEKPDGPYVDSQNRSAVFSNYVMNYGKNGDTRGEKLMGSYNKWGFMTVGECAQGHNSIIAAHDGRTYLVYHTRFNNGTEGFQERVHQVFVNEKGWLVAAPFEYNGETQTDEQNASQQLYQASEVPGKWQVLVHRYGMDYKNKEEVLPVEVELLADGTITGDLKGKWTLTDGTTYIQVTLGGTTYYGVLTEQQMEPTTIKALCFTAAANSGVNAWGYKIREKYQLARQLNTQTIPVSNGRRISGNTDLYGIDLLTNVNLEWTSSEPAIISNEGLYNPAGVEENTPVELTIKEWAGDYYWQHTYKVTAQKDSIPDSDYKSGMLAYYNFDETPIVNQLNTEQTATLKRLSPAEKPQLETHRMRNGQVLHQFTANQDGRFSYAEMENPLYGRDLGEGMTIAFWVHPNDGNLWNSIWTFYDASLKTRLFMTPNAYVGFNNGTDYVDINYAERATNYLTSNDWNHVVVTLSPTAGLTIYVNGALKASSNYTYKGSIGGTEITKKAGVDFQLFTDFVKNCQKFYLGYGSFWSSADMLFDDLMIYDRLLDAKEIRGLYMLANRVYDFASDVTGIEFIENEPNSSTGGREYDRSIYNISGQRISTLPAGMPSTSTLPKGIYIIGGKKVVIK